MADMYVEYIFEDKIYLIQVSAPNNVQDKKSYMNVRYW